MAEGARVEISGNDRPPGRWSAWAWLLLTAALASALLFPALFNRFPLIFPDTPAYLGVAYGHYWTLDRSGFYGLALKPILMTMEPAAALWLAVVLQAIAIAAIVLLAIRMLARRLSPALTAGLALAIVFTTSLPWHAAQLMPDAATGALVLLAWMAASRSLHASGTALLWLGTALLALVHYTHLGLVLATAGATLIVTAWSGVARREIAGRAAVGVLVLAAVASAHVAVNAAYFGRWTVSPMGSLFLFARLNEDGLVPRWLDRHCGRDAPLQLCALGPSLPRDSQVLLWGGRASPLTPLIHERIGQASSWEWIDMMGSAAMGSIWDEPGAFAGSSARAGARQLVHWQALDDECPEICPSAMRDLIGFRPALASPLLRSRQLRGEIDKRPIRWVTSVTALAGQLLLLPTLIAAFRRRDSAAISLLVVTIVVLLANALMAGALSDVHDRYQSRLVWLAPFAVLTLVARWQMFGLFRSS